MNNNNWVKCSDYLPELDSPVFAGWFLNGEFVWHVFMRSAPCDEGWLWSQLNNGYYISDSIDFFEDDDHSMITHWQPLLNPPMPEGE